jgi:hypothetical protein
MNKKLLQDHQKKILSLIKLLGEKNSANIPQIETERSFSIDHNKKTTVIPFKKIK